jgi:hypothetical protein
MGRTFEAIERAEKEYKKLVGQTESTLRSDAISPRMANKTAKSVSNPTVLAVSRLRF